MRWCCRSGRPVLRRRAVPAPPAQEAHRHGDRRRIERALGHDPQRRPHAVVQHGRQETALDETRWVEELALGLEGDLDLPLGRVLLDEAPAEQRSRWRGGDFGGQSHGNLIRKTMSDVRPCLLTVCVSRHEAPARLPISARYCRASTLPSSTAGWSKASTPSRSAAMIVSSMKCMSSGTPGLPGSSACRQLPLGATSCAPPSLSGDPTTTKESLSGSSSRWATRLASSSVTLSISVLRRSR